MKKCKVVSDKVMKNSLTFGEYSKLIKPFVTTEGATISDYFWGVSIPDEIIYNIFKPKKIIFNPPATICYFPDGKKIVVKCTAEDKFIEEVGVMACIVKKIFQSRSKFEKLVKSGYRQPDLKQ